MLYAIAKSYLFKKDAEEAHYFVMDKLNKYHTKKWFQNIANKKYQCNNPDLEREVFGLKFKNPVGLAAGFDKNAKYIDALKSLGFGFVEIGTLTPRPQEGNPKPRLFRLPKDKALINRMGFNNEGVDAAVERLKNRPKDIIIGGNIGKNKDTPNEKAIEDYAYCFKALYDYVDYFTVNVSSPNTPNLRALQDKEPLLILLSHLQELNKQLGKNKPVLLKIAPDLSESQLDDIIHIVKETKLAGLVATNTTIDRNLENTNSKIVEEIGAGGLSGVPVRKKATNVIKYLSEKSKGAFPIIAAGGINTVTDAKEKLDAGASLIQVFTGFVYEGPEIVKNICKDL